MTCKKIGCKQDSAFGCRVYPNEAVDFRIRMGYCPIPDKYFDQKEQEAYWKMQHPNEKRRVGQQKQKRK